MQLTSKQAGAALGVSGGHLRQIETSTKPASLALTYRAEALYRHCGLFDDRKVTVDDLLLPEDTKPDEPQKPQPKQPKAEPVTPPSRTERRGPRRAHDKAVA